MRLMGFIDAAPRLGVKTLIPHLHDTTGCVL